MTDAELSIIGSILVNPESLNNIYTKVKYDMFSDEAGRECYREMCAMYDNGQMITLVGLSARLENTRIDKSVYAEIFKTAISMVQTSAYITHYADEFIKEYQARKLKYLLNNLSLKPCDIQDTMAEIANAIEMLCESKEVTYKSMKEIIESHKDNYFNDKKVMGVQTGFKKLDDALISLECGDVTVIGARPAVGKSAFVVQMLLQMASDGKKVGYFNLEMSDSQIMERAIANTANIHLTRIRRGTSFLGDEEEKYNKACNELSKLSVWVHSGSKSVSEIRQESRHMKYDIIVIDYLQLIKSDRRYANRASEVGDISKSIKALAMELKIPIVLLSQLNRLSENKQSKEPTMAELRESGDIEQDASNIVLLWNLSDDNDFYKGLKIDKNRQGERCKIGLVFSGEHMRFEEYSGGFDELFNQVKQEKEKVRSRDMDIPFA